MGNSYAIYLNKMSQAQVDKRLFLGKSKINIDNRIIFSVLNSVFTYLGMELIGRSNLGEGALDVNVVDYNKIPIVDPLKLKEKLEKEGRLDDFLKTVDRLLETKPHDIEHESINEDARARILTKFLGTVFEKAPFPEDLERGVTKVSKYAVYLVGLVVIISIMGVDIASIFVGLGAFSIAISFATSNIIQNFVSGVLVLGDRAFKVGDFIKIQSFEGKVIKIGIRTTTLEDENANLILIPNSLFITNAVIRKKLNNKS